MTRERRRTVTVSIPFYGCRVFVRRAVESILSQTHKDLNVVLMNDGDPRGPWDLVSDIDDPRLVRIDLFRNRGPYFAHAVALEASEDPFFLIQDADDWSAGDRIAALLDRLLSDECDWASSGVAVHEAQSENATTLYSFRFCGDIDGHLSRRCTHRIDQNGLFKTEALRALGGYYAGFRIGFDTLLMNLCLMVYRHTHVPVPLYHVVRWPNSLTGHQETGFGSLSRRITKGTIDVMYGAAYGQYVRYMRGRLTAQQLVGSIRAMCESRVSNGDRVALMEESNRLRQVLRGGLGRRTGTYG